MNIDLLSTWAFAMVITLTLGAVLAGLTIMTHSNDTTGESGWDARNLDEPELYEDSDIPMLCYYKYRMLTCEPVDDDTICGPGG